MPRKSKQNNGSDMVHFKFHFLEATSFTNGVAAAVLNFNQLETLCLGFANVNDIFRYWRINHLKVRCTGWVESTGSGGHDFALVYSPNDTTGSVTFSNLSDSHFETGWYGEMVTAGANGVPPKPAVLEIPGKVLHTNVEWFTTQNDTSMGADGDGPGTVYPLQRSTTADGILYYETWVDVTFRTRMDPAEISAIAMSKATMKLQQSTPAASGQAIILDDDVREALQRVEQRLACWPTQHAFKRAETKQPISNDEVTRIPSGQSSQGKASSAAITSCRLDLERG